MTGKMPVVYVPEFFPPDSEYAAFAERCRATANGLGSIGLDVTVCVLRRSHIDGAPETSPKYRVLTQSVLANRFFRGNLIMNMSQRLLTSFAVIRLVRRITAGLLFISAHDAGFCVAGRLIAAIRRVPLVFDVQDSQLVLGAERERGVRQYLKTRLEAFALRGAQRVWVPTESLQVLLREQYGVPSGVLSVVPNGVQNSRYSQVSPEREEPNVLLHLGSPRAYYDTDVLIDCFARVLEAIPGAKLRFLGIRNDSYTSNTRKKCAMNGIRDSVEFLAPVPSYQVASFMHRAVIGVHTYALHSAYSATIGMKVAEYMSAGLPILHRGPRLGETWKLVESQRVGLCAETTDELARNAIELLRRPELRRELGDRGRNLAARFDWSNTLKNGVDDIHSIVQSEGANGRASQTLT